MSIKDNVEAKYDIQIELYDLEDDLVRVDVRNLGGDSYNFSEKL